MYNILYEHLDITDSSSFRCFSTYWNMAAGSYFSHEPRDKAWLPVPVHPKIHSDSFIHFFMDAALCIGAFSYETEKSTYTTLSQVHKMARWCPHLDNAALPFTLDSGLPIIFKIGPWLPAHPLAAAVGLTPKREAVAGSQPHLQGSTDKTTAEQSVHLNNKNTICVFHSKFIEQHVQTETAIYNISTPVNWHNIFKCCYRCYTCHVSRFQ